VVGQFLSHYRVIAPLGAGGMGVVYRAHDEQLDRDVALKVLPADALGDEAARVRLVREARLASKLNHPNICTIHEVGEAAPSAGSGQVVSFIAMELIEGQTLSARLAAGALPVAEAARYGQQLADALAHAHERGVVHRDLKSANVVITPEGRAKVLDFGLAKPLKPEALTEALTLSHHSLTALGAIVGTLAYMAPEQLRGQAADARSDIWALGVVLYEMAAGQRPFQGQTGYELSSAILTGTMPPLPAPAAALTDIVERCLAKEPEARFQQGREVTAALEALQSGDVGAPRPPRRPRTSRRWVLAATSVVAGLLVVLAALVGFDIGGLRSRLFAPARVITVAVLPFTGDPEREWFSDGLTEDMIAQLARLHPGRLHVIAFASVKRYKKSTLTPEQIAAELGGLDYVLEGSARREAKRDLIKAELVKVVDHTQAWSDSFERDTTDVRVVQSEVARSVAKALALELLPAEQARLSNARKVNPEAYDACIKGSQLWSKLTPADIDTAEKYFELALQKDPNYAPAHAGIAIVWIARNQMGLSPHAEAGSKARAAASRAVQLDDTSAEGHYALGLVLWLVDWDWERADAEVRRALDLNPSSAETRAGYSHFLMSAGRHDEAMAQIEQALRLDPFNGKVHGFYAVDLVWVRRYDDAVVEARKTLATWPDMWVARSGLYVALVGKRAYNELLTMDRQDNAGDRELEEAYERGYREAGWLGATKRLADVYATRFGKPNGVSAYLLATNYAYVGDTDRAIEWLERAVEANDPTLYGLTLPDFDTLRADPRFQAVLRRLHFPGQ